MTPGLPVAGQERRPVLLFKNEGAAPREAAGHALVSCPCRLFGELSFVLPAILHGLRVLG